MSEALALQRLLAWLSPAFPVGGFAWSAGLETAIAERTVRDAASAREWIKANLQYGAPRTDAILLAHAHRAHRDADALAELADLCRALTPARERLEEMLAMGEAFVAAARAWPSGTEPPLPAPCPYPVAVGAVAGAHGIGLGQLAPGFLSALTQAQISVAVRLVPIGQTEGLAILAGLEPTIARIADETRHAALADIGTIAYASDIAQMRHETLRTRIFRS